MTEFSNIYLKYAEEIGKSVEKYWKEKKANYKIVSKLFGFGKRKK